MENSTTPFSKKCEILAELWMNYRDEEDFRDFIDYNDLGLPLAYAMQNDMIEKLSPTAETIIEETFDLLCAGLELSPEIPWDSLDEMLGEGIEE